MSKSLGNLVFVSDLLKDVGPPGHPPRDRRPPLPRLVGVGRRPHARRRRAPALERWRGARAGGDGARSTRSAPRLDDDLDTPGAVAAIDAAVARRAIRRRAGCSASRRCSAADRSLGPRPGWPSSGRRPSDGHERSTSARGEPSRDAVEVRASCTRSAKAVLAPVFRFAGGHRGRGARERARTGGAIICPEPHLGPRLVLRAARAAPADHLRRQGRVHGQLEDQVPVPGHRHDPHRPRAAATRSSARSTPRPGSSRRASCSASTPRAPGPGTASCTRATPASPGWRCAPAARSCRSACRGTLEVLPPDAKLPKPFQTVADPHRRPIDVSRYLDRADDRLVLRQITDEVDVRDPRAVGPGVRGRVRHQEGRDASRPSRPHRTEGRPPTSIWPTRPTATADGAAAAIGGRRPARSERRRAGAARLSAADAVPSGRGGSGTLRPHDRPDHHHAARRFTRVPPAGTTAAELAGDHRLPAGQGRGHRRGQRRRARPRLAAGRRRPGRHRHRRQRAGPLHDPPLDGPRAGPGRARPVPGRHLRHRAAGRERLLLRLRAARTAATFSADDLERIEARMREIIAETQPFIRDEIPDGRRARAVRRPQVQARDHRRRGRRPDVGHARRGRCAPTRTRRGAEG